jgi:hypothetical protein
MANTIFLPQSLAWNHIDGGLRNHPDSGEAVSKGSIPIEWFLGERRIYKQNTVAYMYYIPNWGFIAKKYYPIPTGRRRKN